MSDRGDAVRTQDPRSTAVKRGTGKSATTSGGGGWKDQPTKSEGSFWSWIKNKPTIAKSVPAKEAPVKTGATVDTLLRHGSRDAAVLGSNVVIKTTRANQAQTPAQTQSDLDTSKDIKEKKDEWDTTCSMVCVGLPEIQAKKNIDVEGVGSYSGAWYATKVTHSISVGGVYKCTIDGGRGRRNPDGSVKNDGSGKGNSKTGSGNPPVLTTINALGN